MFRDIVRASERLPAWHGSHRAKPLTPKLVKKLLAESHDRFEKCSHNIGGKCFRKQRVMARNWCDLFVMHESMQKVARIVGKSPEHVSTIIRRHIEWIRMELN